MTKIMKGDLRIKAGERSKNKNNSKAALIGIKTVNLPAVQKRSQRKKKPKKAEEVVSQLNRKRSLRIIPD